MFAIVEPHLRSPKSRPRNSGAYSQAKAIQQVLYDEAMKEQEKPVTLAALARAWCELEETKRKLRMKPLPKSIDVSKPMKHKVASTTPIDPE